jgi:hypothetical protein
MKNIFKSKWGKWTDLSIATWGNDVVLLQGRRHIDGRVKFRIARNPTYSSVAPITLDDLKNVNPC